MGLIITWTANKKNTVWEGFTNLKQTTKPHVDFPLSRGNIRFPKKSLYQSENRGSENPNVLSMSSEPSKKNFKNLLGRAFIHLTN